MVYEQPRIADRRTPELSHYRAHSKSNPVNTVSFQAGMCLFVVQQTCSFQKSAWNFASVEGATRSVRDSAFICGYMACTAAIAQVDLLCPMSSCVKRNLRIRSKEQSAGRYLRATISSWHGNKYNLYKSLFPLYQQVSLVFHSSI